LAQQFSNSVSAVINNIYAKLTKVRSNFEKKTSGYLKIVLTKKSSISETRQKQKKQRSKKQQRL